MPKSPEHAVKLKDRTLTKLYNERPAWLAKLLALNLSRAGSAAPPPAEADDQ